VLFSTAWRGSNRGLSVLSVRIVIGRYYMLQEYLFFAQVVVVVVVERPLQLLRDGGRTDQRSTSVL
jgi:hypothetical protein